MRPTPPLVRASAAVFVAAVAVYANTLLNGFVVDDHHQIVDNEWITGVRHLPEIFARGVWDFEGRVSSYYRPMMYVFYMATWYVFRLTAWGYHLVNVLLHATASVLVLAIAHRLLPTETERRRTLWLSAPFVAGVLFAVHPVHTEAVAWVAGITDVAMAAFCLLSFWLYMRSEDGGRVALPLAAWAYLLASLSKETGVMLPLILLAYEVIVRRERWDTLGVAVRLLPFAAAAGLYAALRIHALGGLAPTAGGLSLGPIHYALAVVALFAGYVEKLLVPVNLNFWSALSPPASLTSPDALQALVVTGVAVVAVTFVGRHSRPALFGVALILIPLVPAFHLSALNQGLENAMAERYLYFPSVGLVLLAGLGMTWARERWRPRVVVPALALALVTGSLAPGTVWRNTVWRDDLSLWADAVRKSPGSAIAHKNHGAALVHAGHKVEGERELQLAVRMRPDLVDQELLKGAAYAAKGLHKKAILAFHMASLSILGARPPASPSAWPTRRRAGGMRRSASTGRPSRSAPTTPRRTTTSPSSMPRAPESTSPCLTSRPPPGSSRAMRLTGRISSAPRDSASDRVSSSRV